MSSPFKIGCSSNDIPVSARVNRACQAVGKWRTQHLLEGEAFTKTDDRQQHAAESNNKKLE
jgi:hypothetical protein